MLQRSPSPLFVLAVFALAAGCSSPPPPPPPAPPPSNEPDLPHRAAKVALDSLARRNFDTKACDANAARVVSEAELAAPSPPPAGCDVLAAKQINTKWTIVVRPKPPEGQPAIQATVTVTSGAEGVVGIKYDKR